MKRKTVSQIIASRLKDIKGRHSELSKEDPGQPNQVTYVDSKMNIVLDKDQLDNQDKAFLIQYMQSKQRVNFNPKFLLNNMKWIVVKARTLIERHYDFSRKSFYLFKGKLQFYQLANPQCKKELSIQDQDVENKLISTKQKEEGIGAVFSTKMMPRCLVFAENTILLCLQHNAAQLKLIQKNCLMTSKQKQEAISRFSLFQNIQNFNKSYLPYFVAKKFSKGDIVYEIGQTSESWFLVLEGEIQFFQLPQKSPIIDKEEKSPLKHLRNRHSYKQSVLMTQKLSQGCYFGEQEIINSTKRSQTARCFSSVCLLLIIDLQIFQNLLNFSDFASIIKLKCSEKQKQRQSKCQGLAKLKNSSSPQPLDSTQQTYSSFKTKLFNRLQESQKIRPKKLSLRRSKQKIMHGHTIKLPRDNCKTEEEDAAFSMLKVNQTIYLKTLKRFRHSLKEIEEQKKPKKKVEIGEGRSLEKVWNLLGLKEIFSDSSDQEDDKQLAKHKKGRTYYENHVKFKKSISNNGGLRPKGLTTNCRLKRQYLQYLQNCS